MSRNLHKYYYKDYFGGKSEEIFVTDNRGIRHRENRSLDWKNIKSDKNASILKKRNTSLTRAGLLYKIDKPVDTKDTFELEIIYPGLVTGIGINHNRGRIQTWRSFRLDPWNARHIWFVRERRVTNMV